MVTEKIEKIIRAYFDPGGLNEFSSVPNGRVYHTGNPSNQ